MRISINNVQIKFITLIVMVSSLIYQIFKSYGPPLWMNMNSAFIILAIFVVTKDFYYNNDKKSFLIKSIVYYWIINIMITTISHLLKSNIIVSTSILDAIVLTLFVITMIENFMKHLHNKDKKTLKTSVEILIYLIISSALNLLFCYSYAQNHRDYCSRFITYFNLFIPTIVNLEMLSFVILGVVFYFFKIRKNQSIFILIAITIITVLIAMGQLSVIFVIIIILIHQDRKKANTNKKLYTIFPLLILILYSIAYFYPLITKGI